MALDWIDIAVLILVGAAALWAFKGDWKPLLIVVAIGLLQWLASLAAR